MESSNTNNDTTVPVRESQLPTELTASRGVDPNERDSVEILLPPRVESNLEVNEDIIEEMVGEAAGAEALSYPYQKKRGSAPSRAQSKMPVQRPRR